MIDIGNPKSSQTQDLFFFFPPLLLPGNICGRRGGWRAHLRNPKPVMLDNPLSNGVQERCRGREARFDVTKKLVLPITGSG